MNAVKTIAGLVICLSTLSSISIAGSVGSEIIYTHCFGRGIEVRYVKVDLKPGESLPKEIIIDEIKYPLYPTKEEAVAAVKNSAIRKDLTVVYVVSKESKDTEKFDITE